MNTRAMSPLQVDDWLAGRLDEQVTAIVFEVQTDGLLSATEESGKLIEGWLGTSPISPRKGRVARSPRRVDDSAGNRSLELIQKIVDDYRPDPGRRRVEYLPFWRRA